MFIVFGQNLLDKYKYIGHKEILIFFLSAKSDILQLATLKTAFNFLLIQLKAINKNTILEPVSQPPS